MDAYLAAIYGAAHAVALVHWHLFLAREDRGAGRVDSARRSMERAVSIIEDLARARDRHRGRLREGA